MKTEGLIKILAIDPGTKTGWAFSSGDRMESGVQNFGLKYGDSPGMRFVRFNHWLCEDMLGLLKPELVVYEMAHQRSRSATNLLIGMTTRIEEHCTARKIEYTSVHSLTLKKFVTGSGKSSKEDMLKKAREKWGDEIIDDNQSDALWLLEFAKKEFSHEHSCEPI